MTIYCYFIACAFITALTTGGAFIAFRMGEKELILKYKQGEKKQ